tara:strand:+ start:476 stop:1072 length:597 start_codon:yes stop_codon:yes gene_type:complete
MANKKISELNSITTPDDNDVVVIVDTSATETKKITYSNFKSSITGGLPTYSTLKYAFIQLFNNENHTNGENMGYNSSLNLIKSNIITLDGSYINLPSGSIYKLKAELSIKPFSNNNQGSNFTQINWYDSGSDSLIGTKATLESQQTQVTGMSNHTFYIMDATSEDKKVSVRYIYKGNSTNVTYDSISSYIFIEQIGVG